MKKALIGVSCLIIMLIPISCGDINMFSPFGMEEDGSWMDLSLSQGEVLAPDRALSVGIKEPQDLDDPAPSRLQITFFNGKGDVIETREILEPLGMDPWISLPDTSNPEASTPVDSLKSSAYMQLLLDLFDNQGRIIESRKVDFFVTDAVPQIDALEAYPAGGIEVGYQCLILARTDIPLDDSYLRWSMDDVVLVEGRGDELSDQLIWEAPGKAGVYDLILELFPEEPPEILNGTYSFPAAEQKSIQLFVSDADSNREPKDNAFLHHFSFSGTLANSGVLADFSEVIGEPFPALQNGQFGYRFPQEAYLDLPLISGNGEAGDGAEKIEISGDGSVEVVMGAAVFPKGAATLFSLFSEGYLMAKLERDVEGSIMLYIGGGEADPSKTGSTVETGTKKSDNPKPDISDLDLPDLDLPDPDTPEGEAAGPLIILDDETALSRGFPNGHTVYRLNLPAQEPLTGAVAFSFTPSESTMELSWRPAYGLEWEEGASEGNMQFSIPVSQSKEGLPSFQPDRLIVGGEGPLFLTRLGIGYSNFLEQ